jgi:PTS system nitrogen regulatory IIA component
VKIDSILAPERTYCRLQGSSKKRVLEEAAIKIAASLPGIEAEELFGKLISREKIGTTAIGYGVAIPHCRLDGCRGIVGSILTLANAVDFQAFDNLPVNVLFVLLVPTKEVDEHLQVLAMLATRFESAAYREALINATQDSELYQLAIADLNADTTKAQS